MHYIVIISYLVALIQLVQASGSLGCQSNPETADLNILPAHSAFYLLDREVLLSYPRGYKHSTPAPLILAFHDRTTSPEQLKKTSRFSISGVNNQAIVVYPAAKDQKHWMTDPLNKSELHEDDWDLSGENSTNDLVLISKLIERIEKTFCIDTARIYAVGLGTGAGMVQALTCQQQLLRKIAAFVAVQGSFNLQHQSFWSQCRPKPHALPFLGIHGAKNTKYTLDSANEFVQNWIGTTKCGDDVKRTKQLAEEADSHFTSTYGDEAVRNVYKCGNAQGSLTINMIWYLIGDYEEGWPRVPQDSKRKLRLDASSAVLSFLFSHRLSQERTINRDEL